jgi:heme oxygenase (mycobilin-producing)
MGRRHVPILRGHRIYCPTGPGLPSGGCTARIVAGRARSRHCSLTDMPVVKINAIEVPAEAGPELEKRFAHRAHAVENSPGFLGFQLLRPVKGEDRYFVVTQWESEEAFQAWAAGPAIEAHAGQRANPVATGASLLEFEVVLDVAGSGQTA